jgi:hypothetical protein
MPNDNCSTNDGTYFIFWKINKLYSIIKDPYNKI